MLIPRAMGLFILTGIVLVWFKIALGQVNACTHSDLLAYSEDCGKFIQCRDGNSAVRECPRGLVFNVDQQSCDFPQNVPQCDGEYIVELRIVTDVQVLRNYISLYGYNPLEAMNVLENDITVIIHQVNEYLKSLKPYGLKIIVRKEKVDIHTTDILFQDRGFFMKNGSLLVATPAYNRFHQWSNEAIDDGIDVTYDMALLWTGYHLYYNETGQIVNGLTTRGSVCKEHQIGGIFHSDGTQETAWKILRAITFNLGVHRHESKAYNCTPHDMTQVGGYNPNIKDRWELQECSASLINLTLTQLNEDGNNCLKQTSTKDDKVDITTFYDNDIFHAKKICERAVKYKQKLLCKGSFKGIHASQDPLDSANVCQTLYCGNGPLSFIRAVPTEGMTCAKGKRCAKGKCVPYPNSVSPN